MTAHEVVRRARSLVGCRFRPQGRAAATGLDCVGLVSSSFAIAADQVRRDYRLRGHHRSDVQGELGRFFTRVETAGTGDVALCEVAADQLHLAILCGGSFVHADARLRRVVETPGAPPWPMLAAFRHPDLLQD